MQALLPLTEPSQVFVEIPMVAVRKMRGVNCSIITVGPTLGSILQQSPAAVPNTHNCLFA